MFGDVEKENLKIILYSNEKDFQNNGRGLNHISGLYDGMNGIHINCSKAQPQWMFEEIFMHEYTHYIYDLYLTQKDISKEIPQWFTEGVAEYIKYNETIVEYSPPFLQTTEKFKNMDTNEDFQNLSKNEQYDPYMQSYFAIYTLINREGENVISDILLKTKKMDFYEAFSERVGMNIEDFQEIYLEEYIKDLNKRINEELKELDEKIEKES